MSSSLLKTSIALAAGGDADQRIPLIQLHRDEAGGADIAEIGETVAAHIALARGEDQVQMLPERIVLRQRKNGRDRLALGQLQHLAERAPLAVRAALGELPDLLAEGDAAAGEERDLEAEHAARRRRRAAVHDGIAAVLGKLAVLLNSDRKGFALMRGFFFSPVVLSMSAAGVFTRGSIPTASGCARMCGAGR